MIRDPRPTAVEIQPVPPHAAEGRRPAPGLADSALDEREVLRFMLLSRESDRREGILIRQGRGWLQIPTLGHEATAALACLFQPDDILCLYYRDRALMLARGMSMEQIARDFLAVAGSSSQGRNMCLHSSCRAVNIFPPSTYIGSQCVPAVGLAWGMRFTGRKGIVLCCLGDAATRQGEFYEAVAFAVQEKLPVIFLVQDNGYGISTPTRHMLPFRLGIFDDSLVTWINGRDVEDIYRKGREIVQRTRSGHGPHIAWCELDRLGSHTSTDDHRRYRPKAELDAMMEREPIRLFAEKLTAQGKLTPEEFTTMQEDARRLVDDVYLRVAQDPAPDVTGILEHLYAAPVEHTPVPFLPEPEPTTMVAAINRTLQAGLERFPGMILFGQDIEDPKGGVFGFTTGLSTKFPDRVINSPLAEATIIGAGVGAAAVGLRPVFEIQFIDFITPGFTQMVSQLTSLRWRTCGEWSCPVVLYATYGGYIPGGGPYHNQSNDGIWAHLPGLRVAVPSTPEDAAGLFWAAFHDGDPSLILIPKHILRVRHQVRQYLPVPFGQAAIRRPGSDVTVVSWGNCLELADQAAQKVEPDGISVEIIDLRTLAPCDWPAVEASLTKTGRLVVIHEDNRTCGFGQAVIAEMTSESRRFSRFLSPPQLVVRPDVPIPYNATLEYAVLPDLEGVVRAIYATME